MDVDPLQKKLETLKLNRKLDHFIVNDHNS